MAKNPTWIAVVAGALQGGGDQILLQKRPLGKRHAGLWEFPGGKVEPGETPHAALVRELNEELSITADPAAMADAGMAQCPPGEGEQAIVIQLYTVTAWSGTPAAEPGAELGWFRLEEMDALALAPLDAELIRQLAAQGG